MKNNIIVTLSILLATAVMFGTYQRKEKLRFEQNWKAEKSDRGDEKVLTQKELKSLYSEVERMQHKLNIKPKQIYRWIKAPISYIDTGSVRVIYSPSDTVYVYPDSLYGAVDKSCYSLSWLIYKGIFTEQLKYNDTIHVVLYRQRTKKFWFIRYGRFVNTAKLYSSCRDSVFRVEENVRIIK